jgi:hypothetical protein
MQAGKARLWTGISCVGLMVSLAVLALATDAPHAWLPTQVMTPLQEFFSFVLVFSVAALLLLPFDIIGGLVIPTRWEGGGVNRPQWVRRWLRSVGLQTLFYALSFFFYLQIARAAGAAWLIALFAVVQLTLLAGQELIWRLMTMNKTGGCAGHATVMFRHADRRFAGGVTGLPGFESIIVPASWRDSLEAGHTDLLVQRRRAAIASGGRLRGVVLAMFWNITALTLSLLLSGVVVQSVADATTVFLWFLLLSFVGLLLLPALNRQGVHALDRQLSARSGPESLGAAVNAVDQLTDCEASRSAGEESVFQPIPCPVRRQQALQTDGPQTVFAWNVARTALYLSWAFGGPLSRAVHCNVGRPELWAILPTD